MSRTHLEFIIVQHVDDLYDFKFRLSGIRFSFMYSVCVCVYFCDVSPEAVIEVATDVENLQ